MAHSFNPQGSLEQCSSKYNGHYLKYIMVDGFSNSLSKLGLRKGNMTLTISSNSEAEEKDPASTEAGVKKSPLAPAWGDELQSKEPGELTIRLLTSSSLPPPRSDLEKSKTLSRLSGLHSSKIPKSRQRKFSNSAFALHRKREGPSLKRPDSELPSTGSSSSPLKGVYHSLPTISYTQNGLKRNKSNEFNSHRNNSFGPLDVTSSSELRHQPNLFNQQMQNATFDLVRQSPIYEDRPCTPLMRSMTKVNPEHELIIRKPIVPRTVSSPCLSLNERKFEEEKVQSTENVDPQKTLVSILQDAGFKAEGIKFSEMEDYFVSYTEKELESYGTETISAIRKRNIPLLRELRDKGKSLHTANKFGESLIHMACRRGFTDVVKFLIEECDVSPRVKDDYGRTPLHDACWSAEPNFDLMDYLMEQEPDLLLVRDQRGHYPFSYARRNHYGPWTDFLLQRKGKIHLKTLA